MSDYIAVYVVTEYLDRSVMLLKVNGFDDFVSKFKQQYKDWRDVCTVKIDMEQDLHTISCWESGLLVNISKTKFIKCGNLTNL